jgi:serine/threonine protein kinase
MKSDYTGKRLGDFEIFRELGRGGMGVVYEARQVSLNRKVALKVLSGGLGLTPKAVQRFRREAEAAARLHHTNVVPVYATGEQDGTHFYAMELIDGPSLDHVIRDMRTPVSSAGPPSTASGDCSRLSSELEQTGPYVQGTTVTGAPGGLSSSSLGSGGGYFDTVARMIAEVADALEYAHQQGVVHRDMKPSNLLLSPSGRLSVNDFGLARVLEQPGMTMTGEFVGTPAYMSPEQITAGRTPLDHRTDIYSLGATLYELLTLHPPFRAERRDQMLAQILHKEPKTPRRVNPKVPVDLETICLKAVEKDPDRRYQTAGQMGEDLRRFVNRFAIAAKRTGPIKRLRKWVRRHPALTSALVFAVVATAAASVFAYQKYQAEQEHVTERERLEGQVLAAKRDSAMDKAMAAAMGGDKIAADNAIGEAEKLGASTGQVRLARGLVAYCDGDWAEAFRHLTLARELMEDSAAVCAMLALAYVQVGDLSAYSREADLLPKLPVRTGEDHLLKAWLIGGFDPIRGLALLDETSQWRNTGVERLVRSRLTLYKALSTGNLQDAEAAANEAQIACGLLQGNGAAIQYRAEAAQLLAYIHRHAGREADCQRELERAWSDVRALAEYPKLSMTRYKYFYRNGDRDAALEVCRLAAARGNKGFLSRYLVGLYRRQDKGQEVKELLERAKPLDDNIHLSLLHAWVLLESPEVEGKANARLYYEETVVKQNAFWPSLYTIPIAYLLGEPGLAKDAAIRLREKYPRTPWRGGWYSDIANFCAGDLTDEQLETKAAGSNYNKCEGHFFIGMKLLAVGDRRGAEEHFQKAVDTPFEDQLDYSFSRAFLDRMKDSNWPSWISNKETNKK